MVEVNLSIRCDNNRDDEYKRVDATSLSISMPLAVCDENAISYNYLREPLFLPMFTKLYVNGWSSFNIVIEEVSYPLRVSFEVSNKTIVANVSCDDAEDGRKLFNSVVIGKIVNEVVDKFSDSVLKILDFISMYRAAIEASVK